MENTWSLIYEGFDPENKKLLFPGVRQYQHPYGVYHMHDDPAYPTSFL